MGPRPRSRAEGAKRDFHKDVVQLVYAVVDATNKIRARESIDEISASNRGRLRSGDPGKTESAKIGFVRLPIDTRWLTVYEAARFVLSNLEPIRKMLFEQSQASKSPTVASKCFNALNDPVALARLALVVDFAGWAADELVATISNNLQGPQMILRLAAREAALGAKIAVARELAEDPGNISDGLTGTFPELALQLPALDVSGRAALAGETLLALLNVAVNEKNYETWLNQDELVRLVLHADAGATDQREALNQGPAADLGEGCSSIAVEAAGRSGFLELSSDRPDGNNGTAPNTSGAVESDEDED